MKKVFALVLALFVFAAPVFAADIDGKWAGTFSGGPSGDIAIAFNFKADGAKLTGTTTGPDGMELPIKTEAPSSERASGELSP